jgi:hypothetical protein
VLITHLRTHTPGPAAFIAHVHELFPDQLPVPAAASAA